MTRPMPTAPIRLHRFVPSGHCHRVELFLSLLDVPYEAVDVDLRGGQHKSPAFLAMNPFGQVPVIQDGDVTLGDSNAILVYLAGTYGQGTWTPATPLAAAEVQRWLSMAAGPLAFGAAAARAVALFKATHDVEAVRARAHALLSVMDARLAAHAWLASDSMTLADVAHYSYVARAPEGGVSLADYPAVRAWLARIEALPRFVPMPQATS